MRKLDNDHLPHISNNTLSSGNIIFAWFQNFANKLFSKISSKTETLTIEYYSSHFESGSFYFIYGPGSIIDNDNEDSEWYSEIFSSENPFSTYITSQFNVSLAIVDKVYYG